ncbi:MAG TPA: hypothetical protein PL066_01340 [bacterium]|mgnify:CR=1 FL=1|nr:hypothetical protein [bacterium]
MWRALLILIITIGILGGGFYYFADHEGWFDQKAVSEGEQPLNQDSTSAEEIAPIVENPWLDYQYQANGVSFSSKYPAENWKVVEQLNGNELTIIFTNNDSCQVLYLFDIRQGQYKTELSNNKSSDDCAEVLRKIVSIATIPRFGVVMDESTESATTTNVAGAGDANSAPVIAEDKVTDSSNSETSETESTEENEENVEKSDTPVLPTSLSEGVPDQELHEMTAKERYESAKTFVNNYLLEYAKRRWATIESQLSAKAKAELAGKSLSSVATPFYYYELLTVLKEIKVGQFQVNVKLTDKEENPIGESGIYTLNLVWEYGEWKIDNYLFK